MNIETVGIIPAAGRGARLLPFRCAKELLPIGYDPAPQKDGGFRLKMVCQYALESLITASVNHAYVIIGDHKFEIARVLSDGQEFSINLAYLHQRDICGLASAIDCAYNWVHNCISVLVLPDTIVRPSDAVKRILNMLKEKHVQVVLGVFPTDRPQDLCPVEFDSQYKVTGLYDKKKDCNIFNTWGIAAWTPDFTHFLHDYLLARISGAEREILLAEVFLASIKEGMNVLASPFENGAFWDIGKNSSLLKAKYSLEALCFDSASLTKGKL